MPRPNKYLPVDPDARRVRLDLTEPYIRRLDVLAAGMGLPLSALVRLAVEQLADGKPVSAETVRAEADRRRAEPVALPSPAAEVQEKRPRGRPKKKQEEGLDTGNGLR